MSTTKDTTTLVDWGEQGQWVLYPRYPDGQPLNYGISPSTGKPILHRGNCHPGGWHRKRIPEDLLVPLWLGEHAHWLATGERLIEFCDRVCGRVGPRAQ